jgi:HEAT repeat protein
LDQVLAELGELRAKTPADKSLPEKERADLFTALTAMVRSQPESRKKVVALVKQGGPLSGTLLDALGASGHPEAQRALAGFLTSAKPAAADEKQLRIAAIALSQTPSPTPEATATLVKLLDVKGLRIQALYGLGTHVNRLRAEGKAERAKEVLGIILGKLKVADDPVELVTALRGVANSGHEDAFPAVEPLLTSTDDEVRAAAVESLQEMRHPRADAIVARALSSDKASAVRRAAARAALLRTPTAELVAAAKATATSDKNPLIRLGALGVLRAYLPTVPELRSVIASVAESDKEEAIRREAAGILTGTKPSQ